MINKEKLFATLEIESRQFAEKYDGYAEKLYSEAKKVLLLENENELKTIPIQKNLRECCQKLGKYIETRRSN